MENLVPINVVEDNSVQRAIERTAIKLQNKYNKKRKINEKFLKKKSVAQKVFSIIFDVVCFILVIFSALLCFSAINSKIQKTAPSVFGYNNLTISSGSMVASGFEVGDTVIVRSVDTSTLKEGDIIAFYSYKPINSSFDINSCEGVEPEDIGERAYASLTFNNLLGIQSPQIKAAAKAGTSIVFHQIVDVLTDKSGHRFFETKGTSNNVSDLSTMGYVKDTMVLGVYVNTPVSNFMAVVLKWLSSIWGIVLILVPIIAMGAIIFLESLRDVQKAKLECDVVEEKRKLTDPICVKYEIGFGMDKKTKYKVLAQADDDMKNEYVELLWKRGTAPKNIVKYAKRKELVLRGNRKLLQLNRECEKMFADGESPIKISKYYIKQKESIAADQLRYERLLRKIGKRKDEEE